MQVPIRSKRNHLLSVIESLDISRPRDKTDMYSIFRSVAEGTPRRGMMILFSDLLADQAGTLRGLKMLRQRGHDLLVFHILDDDELDFPFAGPTRFEGLESLDHLNCNPRALREGYLDAIRKFLDDSPPRLRAAHDRLRLAAHQRTAGCRPGHLPEQPAGHAPPELTRRTTLPCSSFIPH